MVLCMTQSFKMAEEVPARPPPRDKGRQEVASLPYYHPDLTTIDEVRERMVPFLTNDGHFLLRNSFSKGPGVYTVSVLHQRGIKHFNIGRTKDTFYLQDKHFPSMDQLIRYYAVEDVPNVEGVAEVRLSCAINVRGQCITVAHPYTSSFSIREESTVSGDVIGQHDGKVTNGAAGGTSPKQVQMREKSGTKQLLQGSKSLPPSASEEGGNLSHMPLKKIQSMDCTPSPLRQDFAGSGSIRLPLAPNSSRKTFAKLPFRKKNDSGGSLPEESEQNGERSPLRKKDSKGSDSNEEKSPSRKKNSRSSQEETSLPVGVERPPLPLPRDEEPIALTPWIKRVPDNNSLPMPSRRDYAKVRDVEQDLTAYLLKQLRVQEKSDASPEAEKCDCGLYIWESELPQGWSIHRSQEEQTKGKLFFESPEGTTSWHLPLEVTCLLTQKQQQILRRLHSDPSPPKSAQKKPVVRTVSLPYRSSESDPSREQLRKSRPYADHRQKKLFIDDKDGDDDVFTPV